MISEQHFEQNRRLRDTCNDGGQHFEQSVCTCIYSQCAKLCNDYLHTVNQLSYCLYKSHVMHHVIYVPTQLSMAILIA